MLNRLAALHIVLCGAFLAVMGDTYGQGATSASIKAEFVQEKSIHDIGELAANRLRIINNGRKPVKFSVDLSAPFGWKSINRKFKRVYTVKGRDTIYVPVRVIPSEYATGNSSYLLNAQVLSEKGFQLTDAYWQVQIRKISKWTASVEKRNYYFTHGADTVLVEIFLTNEGNCPLDLRMNQNVDQFLQVYDIVERELSAEEKTFTLPVNGDTVIRFLVRLKENVEALESLRDEYGKLLNPREKRNYRFNLSIQNDSGEPEDLKYWGAKMDFIKLANTKKGEKDFGKIPLTIDVNAQNILSDFTNLSTEIQGNTELGMNRSLAYRFQAFFSPGAIQLAQLLDNYHYIGYRSDGLNIEAGRIGQVWEKRINGEGIRIGKKLGRHTLDGIFSLGQRDRGPKTAAVAHTINVNRNLRVRSTVLREWDSFFDINSTLAFTGADIRIGRNQLINVRGGLSQQNHYWNPNALERYSGFTYGIRYGARFRRLLVNVMNRYYSKDFAGIYSGNSHIAGELRYQLNLKSDIAIKAIHLDQATQRRFQGIIMPGRILKRKEIEFEYGLNSKGNRFVFNPIFTTASIDTLDTRTYGTEAGFRSNAMGDLKLYTNFYTGVMTANSLSGAPKFFIFQARGGVRKQNLNLNLYYLYGPNRRNPLAQINFLERKINLQYVNISGFYNYWFHNNKFLLKTRAIFNLETTFDRKNFALRPTLMYFPVEGIRLRLGLDFSTTTQNVAPINDDFVFSEEEMATQSNFFVHAGLRAELGMRVKSQNRHDVKLMLFKDKNANGIRDKNEPGLRNILVRLTKGIALGKEIEKDQYSKEEGGETMTEDDGIVKYSGLPSGIYDVELEVLEDLGWFPAKKGKIMVHQNRTFNIPLVQGIKIDGTLIIDRDKYSFLTKEQVQISKIRVTAIDSAGNAHSTLTDADGNFSLFVPKGKYRISVNENGLGDMFRLVRNDIEVDLRQIENRFNMSFYVVEKRRKVNIRKF